MILLEFPFPKAFSAEKFDFGNKIVKKNRKKIVNASKVPRIWFSAKNSRNFPFFYDFARVSLENRKKIVNASKVSRIWFSAKNSRNFRFFYDFARVPFSPKPFQQKNDFGSKIVKKS